MSERISVPHHPCQFPEEVSIFCLFSCFVLFLASSVAEELLRNNNKRMPFLITLQVIRKHCEGEEQQ